MTSLRDACHAMSPGQSQLGAGLSQKYKKPVWGQELAGFEAVRPLAELSRVKCGCESWDHDRLSRGNTRPGKHGKLAMDRHHEVSHCHNYKV